MDRKEDARERYEKIRSTSYKTATTLIKDLYKNFQDIEIKQICENAINATNSWQSRQHESFDWNSLHQRFSKRAKRVDLAIWVNGQILCGISLGKISRGKINATIHYLESAPDNPLKGYVGAIATTYLMIYGELCQCKIVQIDKPVKALIDYYKELGFSREVSKKGNIIRLESSITAIREKIAKTTDREMAA